MPAIGFSSAVFYDCCAPALDKAGQLCYLEFQMEYGKLMREKKTGKRSSREPRSDGSAAENGPARLGSGRRKESGRLRE